MNKKIASVFLIMGLLMLYSCGNNEKLSGYDIEIIDIAEAVENPKVIKLGKYASQIRYIPLEYSSQSMLGDATRLNIIKLNDVFCIWATPAGTLLGDPVMCFNEKGDFLNSVGVHGRADNEFLTICNVFANDRRNLILISDRDRALVYSKEGLHKYNFDMCHNGILGVDGAWLENDMFVFIKRKNFGAYLDDKNPRSDELVVVDTTGTVINRFDLGNHILRTFEHNDPFLGKGTGVLTKRATMFESDNYIRILRNNDIIYDFNIIERKLKAEYKVNFGKYGTDNVKIGANINSIMESDRFILMRVIFSSLDFPNYNQNYINSYLVYDKTDKKTMCIKFNSEDSAAVFTNDIDGGMNFYPQYIKDGKMYQIVNAIDFIEMAEKSTSAHMKEVAAQLTEESNPVVVEVTLK